MTGFFCKLQFVFLFCLLSAVYPLAGFSFKFAFITQHDENTPQVLDCNSMYSKLAHGDKIKIYLKPQKDAYLYIFFHDAQDVLYPLFPYDFRSMHLNYQFEKNYYIPNGNEWFVLDNNSGVEKFYLLAGSARLPKLERLVQQYLDQVSDKKNTDNHLPEAKQKIIEEIRTLRLSAAHNQSKEEMVLSSCDFRGLNSLFEFKAIDVQSDSLYVKTIRIEH